MIRPRIRVEGLEQAVSNLNREIGQLKRRTPAGLRAGGLLIQRESQKRVPVEYGNLRASAYTRRTLESDMQVEVGYEAAYALYVHENLEMKLKGQPRPSGLGVYWGPRGEAQFLANAVEARMDDVVRVVASYAEVQ